MSDVKRFDCTNGGAQFCDGCYTMTQDDEYGDYVLFSDYETLRARLSRQQEWIDAVMGQGSWYAPCDNETVLVIIRPRPLAKE